MKKGLRNTLLISIACLPIASQAAVQTLSINHVQLVMNAIQTMSQEGLNSSDLANAGANRIIEHADDQAIVSTTFQVLYAMSPALADKVLAQVNMRLSIEPDMTEKLISINKLAAAEMQTTALISAQKSALTNPMSSSSGN